MDPNTLRGLNEAYSAVYDEKLRNELEEMADEFAGIEDLSDEQIDAIVEETIEEMLEEGYEFDEVEEIFEEVLLELNPYAPAGSKAAKAYNKATTVSKKGAERSAARAATVSKVKGAVKSALSKAKKAATSVIGGARKAIKSTKQKSHVGAATYASKRGLMPGAGLKTQSSKGRAELRSAVAKDIAGRVKKKVAQAQVGAHSAARKAGQAASDVAGKAKQSAKYTAARTKRGIKGAIGAAASRVASGASKLAARMAAEEVDVYDVVISHLLDEGYAETHESAEKIMVNMSEAWVDQILEDYQKK